MFTHNRTLSVRVLFLISTGGIHRFVNVSRRQTKLSPRPFEQIVEEMESEEGEMMNICRDAAEPLRSLNGEATGWVVD